MTSDNGPAKLDLHFHTMISRQLPFSEDHLLQMLDGAVSNGIGTIAITDHIESADYGTVRSYMRRTFPFTQGGYDVRGLRVFPGTEVQTSEGIHVLFLGLEEELDELHRRMEPMIQTGYYPSLRELFARSSSLELLTVWAHPFRETGTDGVRFLRDLADEEDLPHFDALDLNAKDIYLHGEQMVSHVQTAAVGQGLPVVGGSDAHHPSQVGSVYNSCERPVVTFEELRAAIEAGALTPHVSRELQSKVAEAQEFKKRVLEEALPGRTH
ncbi:MAG: PHP-associated domain-containing protein [Spirochaetaceae bacterium]